ncbi:unnamed protein product [Dicrocoelium dendriticum]|nr:unnamed protein product [Dicrocoelium dendriticum]
MKKKFTADAWRMRWAKNDIAWHNQHPHRQLVQYWDKFYTGNPSEKLIFVPLCGKSIDLRWLYCEKGFSVVGCDLSETALLAFVTEHPDLAMQRTEVLFKNGERISMFHTPDKRLRLYLCDLFIMDQSQEGPFKYIWDRGSLVAVDQSLQKRYVDFVSTLITPDARWLLETLNYPEGIHDGPPCRIPDEECTTLFGHGYSFELLHAEYARRLFPNATYCYIHIILLTRIPSR